VIKGIYSCRTKDSTDDPGKYKQSKDSIGENHSWAVTAASSQEKTIRRRKPFVSNKAGGLIPHGAPLPIFVLKNKKAGRIAFR
jgi:hypothetical protein